MLPSLARRLYPATVKRGESVNQAVFGLLENRGVYGVQQAMRGSGDEWLSSMAEMLESKEGLGQLCRSVYSPTGLSMLVTAAAMVARRTENPDLIKNVINKIGETAGVQKSIRNLFSKDTVEYLGVGESWMTPFVDAHAHTFKFGRTRTEHEREVKGVLIAHALRLGVAIGSDDTGTLISMVENERDSFAGPVAALRVSNHGVGDAAFLPRLSEGRHSEAEAYSLRKDLRRDLMVARHPVTKHYFIDGRSSKWLGPMQYLSGYAVLDAISALRAADSVDASKKLHGDTHDL
jgi:hypothetical protein